MGKGGGGGRGSKTLRHNDANFLKKVWKCPLICKYKRDFTYAQFEFAPEASSLQPQNPGNEAHLQYAVIQLQVTVARHFGFIELCHQIDPVGDRQLYFIVAYPPPGTLVTTVLQ